MAFGAEFINENSDLVITDGFLNFKHCNGGTIAPGTVLNTITHQSGDIPPLFAASPQDRAACYYTPLQASAPHTSCYIGQDTGGSQNIPYSVQDLVGETPTGNYGMQIWDAASNIVFDSRLKYLDIVDIQGITNTLTGVPASTQDITHATLANAYYNLSALSGFMAYPVYIGTPYPYNIFICGRGVRQISSTVARLSWVTLGFIPSSTPVNVMHAPDTTLLVSQLLG